MRKHEIASEEAGLEQLRSSARVDAPRNAQLSISQRDLRETGAESTYRDIGKKVTAQRKERDPNAELPADQRFAHVLAGLEQLSLEDERLEPSKRPQFRGKLFLYGDAKDNVIKNQQIYFYAGAAGEPHTVDCSFMAGHFKLIQEHLGTMGAEVTDGAIIYSKKDDPTIKIEFVKAKVITLGNGITVKISTQLDGEGKPVRSSLGYVQIEIPREESDWQERGRQLNKIFEDILAMDGGVSFPSEAACGGYMARLYAAHAKRRINEDEVSGQDDWRAAVGGVQDINVGVEGAQPLQEISLSKVRVALINAREDEVAPGYSTISIPRTAEGLRERHGDFAIIHLAQSYKYIPDMVREGMRATAEREASGMVANVGLSRGADVGTGGGTVWYTRVVTEKGLSRQHDTKDAEGNIQRAGDFPVRREMEGVWVVLANTTLDRLDTFGYDEDKYGTTSDPENKRLTPTEIFLEQGRKGYSTSNELVVSGGQNGNQARAFVCVNEKTRNNLIRVFHERGMSEINGRRVEDMITVIKGQEFDYRPPGKNETIPATVLDMAKFIDIANEAQGLSSVKEKIVWRESPSRSSGLGEG